MRTVCSGVVALLLGTAVVAAQAPPQKPGPEHKRLERMVGQWQYEGEAKASPLGPAGKISGSETCEWFQGGFGVVCRSKGTGPKGPMTGLNDAGDEFDGAWLAGGRAVVFARGNGNGGAQLQLSHCRHGRWSAAQPLALSFNSAEGDTRAALVDASTPGELLVSGHARAPRAGGFDLYRMRAPASDGSGDCR